MAETAPLTTARFHARQAAEQIRRARWDEAAVEHEQAAAGFSRAARGTSDAEGLRILSLLEAEHCKLAGIIKGQSTPQPEETLAEDARPIDGPAIEKDPPVTPRSGDELAIPKAKQGVSALAAAKLSSRTRDVSPSLAREIASRRGIPPLRQTRPSAAAQARIRQLSPESQRRAKSASTPKIAPSVVDSQATLDQAKKAKKVEDDEGFAKFYGNLTTGTMSKLSSVLAYAGLPLTADDIQQNQASAKPKSEKRTVSATNEPDVKNIFSKAALKAIEDEHRQRGTQGQVFGPAESFYVVQTGGGTYSYADIAKAQQQGNGFGGSDEDAYVDAREAPGSPSPRHSRDSTHRKRGSFGNPRTGEELELENTTLKHTLEQLASRLANFEVHAQDASLAALTQSMMLRPAGGGGGGDATLQDRLMVLEQQLEQQTQEKQRLETLAAKQEGKIKMYHAKWEEVKKSAKEKERVKRERAGRERGALNGPEPG